MLGFVPTFTDRLNIHSLHTVHTVHIRLLPHDVSRHMTKYEICFKHLQLSRAALVLQDILVQLGLMVKIKFHITFINAFGMFKVDDKLTWQYRIGSSWEFSSYAASWNSKRMFGRKNQTDVWIFLYRGIVCKMLAQKTFVYFQPYLCKKCQQR